MWVILFRSGGWSAGIPQLVRPVLTPYLLWLGGLVLRLVVSIVITYNDIHLGESIKVR
jgi:hypothetical protein